MRCLTRYASGSSGATTARSRAGSARCSGSGRRNARAVRPRRTPPRESRAGTRAPARRAPAARQLSVMPCGSARVEGLDHRVSCGMPKPGRVQASSGDAGPAADARLADPDSSAPRTARRRRRPLGRDVRRARSARARQRRVASLRLSLSDLVSSTRSLTEPLPTRGATNSSSCWSSSVKPRRESIISTTPARLRAHLEVVGHHRCQRSLAPRATAA